MTGPWECAGACCSWRSCSGPPRRAPAVAGRRRRRSTPSLARPILLVTLDTTRADAIGPDAAGVETPAFNALAARGRRYRAGVRDGARDAAVAQLDDDGPLSGRSRRPRKRAVPVRPNGPCSPSSCSRRAIARPRSSRRSCSPGGSASRADSIGTTTRCRPVRPSASVERRRPMRHSRARARRRAAAASCGCTTTIRTRPTRRRSRTARSTRRSRTSAKSRRWTSSSDDWSRRSSAHVTGTVGDRRRRATTAKGSAITAKRSTATLLYQSTMHVPLVLVGPGRRRRRRATTPVSTRRIFDTVLDWAGIDAPNSLRSAVEPTSCSARR